MLTLNKPLNQNRMKTSVEWLVKEINKLTGLTIQMDEPIIEQANKMFEEQIMDAYNQGSNDYGSQCYQPEQYYNETFKSE
jgi:hypothetical protein